LGVDDDDPSVAFETVAQALADGFRTTLNLTFTSAPPSPDEIRRAGVLIREQFANPEWTEVR